MTLLAEINADAATIASTRRFLETFDINSLVNGDSIVSESVSGVLDRIQHLVQSSKYGISQSDASKVAKTLASLKFISSNRTNSKYPSLNSILDAAGSADLVRGLENAVPGASRQIAGFEQELMADMGNKKQKTLSTIKELRSLSQP